jgi:hypothetical protein
VDIETAVAVQDLQAPVHVNRFQHLPPGPLHHDQGSKTAGVDPSCILFIEKEMCSADHRNYLGLFFNARWPSAEQALFSLRRVVGEVDNAPHQPGITRNYLPTRPPKHRYCLTLPHHLYRMGCGGIFARWPVSGAPEPLSWHRQAVHSFTFQGPRVSQMRSQDGVSQTIRGRS